MFGRWKIKFYCSCTISIVFFLNMMHTDARVSRVYRIPGLTQISNFIRDTGMTPDVPMNQLAETQTDIPAMARIFYSAIGDIVETVPIFPITLNVPDMVSAFSGLLSGMFNYISGSTSGQSQPKDVLGAMFELYKHIAVQEDIHDLEFMT